MALKRFSSKIRYKSTLTYFLGYGTQLNFDKISSIFNFRHRFESKWYLEQKDKNFYLYITTRFSTDKFLHLKKITYDRSQQNYRRIKGPPAVVLAIVFLALFLSQMNEKIGMYPTVNSMCNCDRIYLCVTHYDTDKILMDRYKPTHSPYGLIHTTSTMPFTNLLTIS